MSFVLSSRLAAFPQMCKGSITVWGGGAQKEKIKFQVSGHIKINEIND